MIWYYSNGPNVILRVLISERERQESQCQSDTMGERLHWPLLALKMEEGAMSQECGQPLEVGKGKEMHSPPEHSERTQP